MRRAAERWSEHDGRATQPAPAQPSTATPRRLGLPDPLKRRSRAAHGAWIRRLGSCSRVIGSFMRRLQPVGPWSAMASGARCPKEFMLLLRHAGRVPVPTRSRPSCRPWQSQQGRGRPDDRCRTQGKPGPALWAFAGPKGPRISARRSTPKLSGRQGQGGVGQERPRYAGLGQPRIGDRSGGWRLAGPDGPATGRSPAVG